ncbi:hypothetical protein SteCoe_19565 [Stentor coeruleus]|uniref:Kinesin motor domain-containing protein n=1 Tax=Stentor coeruleus TaxID=5963 RepID=A0A1R2BUA5_9CILI|nr:hypothetical protein SteCoe_19565 [Stentor coeruleus]
MKMKSEVPPSQHSSAGSHKNPSHPPSVSGTSSMLEQDGGESVKVCVRIRPMSQKELSAGNTNCIEVQNPQLLHLKQKNSVRQYAFHQILEENINQAHVFAETGVGSLLESSLDGYSCTIFAYGQTGSGKTYTMAGSEERLGRADYVSDETDGIIPRSISYVWQRMNSRNEKFFVKSGFFEIYNEQVRDLLNPSSGVKHCRWNLKQGFFVEELMVVDCLSIDDMIAVLNEGMRNRKSGSHELNADSSRSHSILMTYFISEIISEEGHSIKRYGKSYFIDLAGSERLKETQSSGGMLVETKNINRSLFVLGKVISSLGDKKYRGLKPHVPYRDSKLTMVLMDSLGGSSRALMIACVSPAISYVEETASTLNYATRAMNIRNKPLLQVDSQEHLILNLRREVHFLKMENEYLREQLTRAAGGLPPLMVDYANSKSATPKEVNIHQHQAEVNTLRDENLKLREERENAEKNYHKLMIENQNLYVKLENLESTFVGAGLKDEGRPKISQDYTINTLINENANLKKRLNSLQQENSEITAKYGDNTYVNPDDIKSLHSTHTQLKYKVDELQKRERELLDLILRAKKKE